MPNTPVPAAATGLPETSRRAVLASSAALVATVAASAIGVAGACAAPAETPLSDLIKAHRAAYEQVEHTTRVRNHIDDEVDEDRRKNPVLVPIAVMPNGECRSGYCQLGQISPVDIRKRIVECHDRLREIHCSRWSREMFPEMMAAAERALAASQDRALQALADAQSRMEERERNAGLTAAEEAFDEACDVEFEARLSLAVYVPLTAAEREAKSEYIAHSPPFKDAWCDSEFVDAMIARISGFETDLAIAT